MVGWRLSSDNGSRELLTQVQVERVLDANGEYYRDDYHQLYSPNSELATDGVILLYFTRYAAKRAAINHVKDELTYWQKVLDTLESDEDESCTASDSANSPTLVQ